MNSESFWCLYGRGWAKTKPVRPMPMFTNIKNQCHILDYSTNPSPSTYKPPLKLQKKGQRKANQNQVKVTGLDRSPVEYWFEPPDAPCILKIPETVALPGRVRSSTQCRASSKSRMADWRKDDSFAATGVFTTMFPLWLAMCCTFPFLISTASELTGECVARSWSNNCTWHWTDFCNSSGCVANWLGNPQSNFLLKASSKHALQNAISSWKLSHFLTKVFKSTDDNSKFCMDMRSSHAQTASRYLKQWGSSWRI